MTIYTAFRCPEDLLAKAKIKATADHRSLSKYIIMLLDKATAGMPPPPKAKTVAKAKKPAKR